MSSVLPQSQTVPRSYHLGPPSLPLIWSGQIPELCQLSQERIPFLHRASVPNTSWEILKWIAENTGNI